MQTQTRGLTELDDLRLVYRGNRLLADLFRKSAGVIRQACASDAAAKGAYRFLNNDRVTEDDLVMNLSANCVAACRDKYVVGLQDTTNINLSAHAGRLKRDDAVGRTHQSRGEGLGFLLHPCLLVDAERCLPYGYADVKVWSQPPQAGNKAQRDYKRQPTREKESYKWIEVANNTKAAVGSTVKGLVLVQDRESDIYELFAMVPDEKTELVVRARADRTLLGGAKLFRCLAGRPSQGHYDITVAAKGGRAKRTAHLEVRFTNVTLRRPFGANKSLAPQLSLCFIEAREVGYTGPDALCWRLLTTLAVDSLAMARLCLEWYSWRWMIEEVFKILKKEGYDIEASELESAGAIRKLSLLILEAVIKLFLMRLAYAEPEESIEAAACFSPEEQRCLEAQIKHLEGKTKKQKNPYGAKDLKRYVWAIARLGGWKGYESKRHPGITTLWTGMKHFQAAFQGWQLHRNVSTR